MELVVYVALGALVIVALIGWFMFAKENPLTAALLMLIWWE